MIVLYQFFPVERIVEFVIKSGLELLQNSKHCFFDMFFIIRFIYDLKEKLSSREVRFLRIHVNCMILAKFHEVFHHQLTAHSL